MDPSLTTLLDQHAGELVGHLPGIRDANVESVHDARVATRRFREALPLFGRAYPDDVERLTALLRRAGRRLGRVRELDVMDEDLARRAGRLVAAAHAIGAARRTLAQRQGQARRKLIKAFERLGLETGGALQLPAPTGLRSRFTRSRGPKGWEEILRARIVERAEDLRVAIEHASGVYFPKRAHRARVAVKKLRYGCELAYASGLWRPPHLVGDLKRAQESLGRLHDAQVLLDSTDELVEDGGIDPAQVRMLKADLAGEIVQHHADYLGRRERLLRACAACEQMPRSSWAPRFRPLIAASALAVPAGLLLVAGRDH